jgi:hypothetical protein
MFADAKRHSLQRISEAPVQAHPFPHVIVEDVFPAALYAELQRRFLPTRCYKPLASTGRVSTYYNPARYCLMPDDLEQAEAGQEDIAFWKALFETYRGREFAARWLGKFQPQIQHRMATELSLWVKDGKLSVTSEIFLMRDLQNYELFPHTDSPKKLISVLFYLPADDAHPELGTALYSPRTPGFSHRGGPQLDRKDFDLVQTVPFRPNTLLAFPKSSVCFHGVEPVRGPDRKREILFFDIKISK